MQFPTRANIYDSSYISPDSSVCAGVMRCLVLLCAITAVLGTSPSLHVEQWRLWKERHGKVYADEVSESARRWTWQKNRELVKTHNQNSTKHGYTLALNQFADLSNEEFTKRFLSSPPVTWTASSFSTASPEAGTDGNLINGLPTKLDWRDLGYVTPVKDQGDCGSCWAFSATGALEGQHFRRKESLIALSEQQLMDCSWDYDNYGCDGGKVDCAFDYVTNNGICANSDYSYLSYVWKCMDSYCTNKVNSTGYVRIQSGNETALLDSLARVGPVSIAIDASGYQFQFYSEGIYTSTQCDSTHLNHAMLAVGYSSYYGDKYWIMKNSWGQRWGLDGYIRVAREESNMCGVATAAMYPVLA